MARVSSATSVNTRHSSALPEFTSVTAQVEVYRKLLSSGTKPPQRAHPELYIGSARSKLYSSGTVHCTNVFGSAQPMGGAEPGFVGEQMCSNSSENVMEQVLL